jgi:lipid-binding SYLF domain-containing protein
MSRRTLLIATALVLTGCAGSPPADPAAKRREIDARVDNAIAELNRSPSLRDLTGRAQGILVFPEVASAGFIVGATYGEGALRTQGRTAGYYSINAGSVGLLAGAQTKTMYILFLTPEALRKFQDSNGWTAGTDASVALLDVGAEGRVDTSTAHTDVIGLVRNQTGFMANLSLDGTKFNRLSI